MKRDVRCRLPTGWYFMRLMLRFDIYIHILTRKKREKWHLTSDYNTKNWYLHAYTNRKKETNMTLDVRLQYKKRRIGFVFKKSVYSLRMLCILKISRNSMSDVWENVRCFPMKFDIGENFCFVWKFSVPIENSGSNTNCLVCWADIGF